MEVKKLDIVYGENDSVTVDDINNAYMRANNEGYHLFAVALSDGRRIGHNGINHIDMTNESNINSLDIVHIGDIPYHKTIHYKEFENICQKNADISPITNDNALIGNPNGIISSREAEREPFNSESCEQRQDYVIKLQDQVTGLIAERDALDAELVELRTENELLADGEA